jgi:hypothetical protein
MDRKGNLLGIVKVENCRAEIEIPPFRCKTRHKTAQGENILRCKCGVRSSGRVRPVFSIAKGSD